MTTMFKKKNFSEIQTYIRFVVFVVSPKEKSILKQTSQDCQHVLVKYVSDVQPEIAFSLLISETQFVVRN